MPTNSQGHRKLLFISNLFPDSEEPVRGLDNATLLHELSSEWTIRVISPRPVFPPWENKHPECRPDDGDFEPVFVPSPYLPRIGDRWNDHLMTRSLAPAFKKVAATFKPDAVLASWLFPDGCAVTGLCKQTRLPVILITQGTDTHRYLDYPVRRRKILAAIEGAAAVVCRSGDLAKRLEAAGADPAKLKVIYNGVNPAIFRHRDRDPVRRELGLDPREPVLLFVGNFLPVKDPLFLIRAHAELNRRRTSSGDSPARLIMVGDGPLRNAMEFEIAKTGGTASVELRTRMAPDAIARWMNAADLLCLSSRNEGFPNVILEAMACGLPVVSTDVGGIHELVKHPRRGQLVTRGNLEHYVEALVQGLAHEKAAELPGKEATATEFKPGWERAAREYGQLIESRLRDSQSC